MLRPGPKTHSTTTSTTARLLNAHLPSFFSLTNCLLVTESHYSQAVPGTGCPSSPEWSTPPLFHPPAPYESASRRLGRPDSSRSLGLHEARRSPSRPGSQLVPEPIHVSRIEFGTVNKRQPNDVGEDPKRSDWGFTIFSVLPLCGVWMATSSTIRVVSPLRSARLGSEAMDVARE